MIHSVDLVLELVQRHVLFLQLAVHVDVVAGQHAGQTDIRPPFPIASDTSFGFR